METDIFNKFESDLNKLNAFNELLNSSLEEKEKLVISYDHKHDLYAQCSELFKSWLNDLLDKNVNSIAELVTSGLNHIIDDQDLNFLIKQEPKHNRISMSFLMKKGDLEGDPMDSFGGGTVMVASFILRLAIMSRLNMSNLLVLDEPLGALADKYIPNCGEFIRQLSEKTGINILAVTHNREFLNYSHVSYEGRLVPNEVDGKNVDELILTKFTNEG